MKIIVDLLIDGLVIAVKNLFWFAFWRSKKVCNEKHGPPVGVEPPL